MFQGQEKGSIVEEESYFDVLRDFQQLTDPYNRKYMNVLNNFYKWVPGDLPDYEVFYRTRKVLSQTEELELHRRKLDLMQIYAKFLDPLHAFDKAGIKNITEEHLLKVTPLIEQTDDMSVNPNDPKRNHSQERPEASDGMDPKNLRSPSTIENQKEIK